MTGRPRILVIGYCYPPTASPEAFVSAKLLRNIPDCEIDVLTLEDGLVNNYYDKEMGEYAAGINGKVIKVRLSPMVKMLCSLPRLPLRPDRWLLANKSTRKKAIKLDPNSYDCIVTRSQYHSAHLVGLSLKKSFPNVPWIACFSDPWSESDHQKSVPIFSLYSRYQESRVLKKADKLVFPTEGLLKHMTQEVTALEKKSWVIPHCYDPDLYNRREKTKAETTPKREKEFCWRIFGSFYGIRQPDILLRALQILNVPQDKKIRLEIYGTFHEKYNDFDLFNSKFNDRKICYMGQTPHKNALWLMQESDLLIVIDGSDSEQSFYLPSKIIDYFGSETRILSICSTGTVEQITLAAQQNVARMNDALSIANEMERILNHPNTKEERQTLAHQYHSNNVGKRFLNLIHSVM